MGELSYKCNVPVLLIIFNRLETTKRVMEQICQVKPTNIYIAADGARNQQEQVKCDEIRKFVLSSIDWEANVQVLYRERNLGCRLAVSGAISWFFDNVEMGIILEDDCLPSTTFFKFCENILTKYENNAQIMHISGTNNQFGISRGQASYYYSRIAHIWGWATWRRAWIQYDLEMKKLPLFILSGAINRVFNNNSARLNFLRILLQIKLSNSASTWDYQWSYSIILKQGICITPNVNLVSNIGFGTAGTHALDSGNKFSNIPTDELETIAHPEYIYYDNEADNYEGDTVFKFPDFNTIFLKVAQKIGM